MAIEQSRSSSSLGICIWTVSIIVICSWVISILILACVPPVSRDALTHHLFVPNLFLKAGGFVDIPALHVSYYPMNIDLLYLIPLIQGVHFSKLFHNSRQDFQNIVNVLFSRFLAQRKTD